MRIGKLRHLCIVQYEDKTTDSFGDVVSEWKEFCKMWADIKPLNGNEKYVSSEKHATATHQVIARFKRGVNPKMRLIYGERIFEIKSALNVNEQSKMLQIICEETADLYEVVIEAVFDCAAVVACDTVFCEATA